MAFLPWIRDRVWAALDAPTFTPSRVGVMVAVWLVVLLVPLLAWLVAR